MAESPPPGYSGGSILPQPTNPIEMKVFQGGGFFNGNTSQVSLLEQPAQELPMTEFRGGARVVAGESIPKVRVKGVITSNKEGVHGLEGMEWEENSEESLANSEESKESVENSEESKESLGNSEGNSEGNSVESLANSLGTNTNTLPPKTSVQTIKLSNGLRVRLMPPDDSLKEDIVSFRFTGDEQALFDTVLHFKHPFIHNFLKENQDEFYEFWKLYTTYDGTDQFTLMTYSEGQEIQRFMKKVLDAYRHYLTSAALAFLLKQEHPELLELMKEEPEKEAYALMETILIPKEKEEEVEITLEESEEPEEQEETQVEVQEEEDEEKEEEKEEEEIEEEEDEHEVRKENLIERLNTILQGDLPQTRARKRLFLNQKLRDILNILDDEIANKKEYEDVIRNSGDITSTSFLPARTNIERFLLTQLDPEEKITDFLRNLLKIDLTQLDEKNKKSFHSFFLKIINPKATSDFYTYVFGSAEKA